ncbi:30S ribosomal protein S16 [bacterium]|nr:30S ribosomal protein S16 [bacterium]
MVKIRLTRTGKKNSPSYRIVVSDSRSKRDGRFLEILGHFNPSQEPALYELDAKRFDYWVKRGAQPTEAVVKLKEGNYKYTPYDAKALKEQAEKALVEADEEAKKKSEEAVVEKVETESPVKEVAPKDESKVEKKPGTKE